MTDLDWFFDGIGGPGWVRRAGGDGVDNAHIFLASEADRERKEARDREPQEPMRWRRHRDSWQRWSELDRSFATMEPPDTLEAHVAAVGMPAENEELVFVDGAWVVADDHLGTPDEEEPEELTPVPPAAPTDRHRDEAEFSRQRDAWRNRR